MKKSGDPRRHKAKRSRVQWLSPAATGIEKASRNGLSGPRKTSTTTRHREILSRKRQLDWDPAGNSTVCYGTSPFLTGESSNSMGPEAIVGKVAATSTHFPIGVV